MVNIIIQRCNNVVLSELSTKVHYTSESSSSAKQEVDNLRDEVKALTSQLLRQHDATMDSRVKNTNITIGNQ